MTFRLGDDFDVLGEVETDSSGLVRLHPKPGQRSALKDIVATLAKHTTPEGLERWLNEQVGFPASRAGFWVERIVHDND